MISKPNFTQNERGRSMVEILGVLAIIGVLSFGGIQGYRYAMEKHRANDIVNEVNLRTRDTWNMYQTKDLPDEEEITEWADMTQTGFPIGVYPRSEILFDVEVENVPNGVCKKVLNMDIQGPLFIWVPNGEERLIYNGNNPEICGEDGDEPVNMVFTTSLESFGNEEGLRGNPEDPNGRPFRYCMSDDDCQEKCERCGVNYTCQSDCPAATPICSTNEYKVCVVCESNEDCPENQICDESSGENQCVEVPDKCAEGYFRSKNGACIECSYGGNIIVSEEAFSGVGIQDDKTGLEMCNACETVGKKRMLENITNEDGSKTYYCSKTCTKGISVQTTDRGCVSCGDFPAYVDYKVVTDVQVQEQCKACGLVYYEGKCGQLKCPDNKFKINYSGTCQDCTTWVSDGTAVLKEECLTNCHGLRKIDSKNTCAKICPQPSDMSDDESVKICKEEGPTSPNCKRTFVGNFGAAYSCYSCNASTSYSLTNVPAEDKALCEKCGRWYHNDYCHLNGPKTCINKKDENGNNSQENQFRGYDASCVSCTNTTVVRIEETEEAQNICVNNCKGVVGSIDGISFVGREVYTRDDGRKYCVPITPVGYFYGMIWPSTGLKFSKCSDIGATYTDLIVDGWANENLKTICKKCTEREVLMTYHHIGHVAHCSVKNCPENYFHDVHGTCVPCDVSTSSVVMLGNTDKYHSECLNCGRYPVGYNCLKYTPGQNGVCNSKDNGTLNPYPSGDGKLLRDINGTCQDCENVNARYSMNSADMVSQCGQCPNRRLVGSECVYGLCEQASTFMTVNNTCASCSSDTTQIPDTTVAREGCLSCDRSLMTVNTSQTTTALYCVKEDCGEGITYITSTDKTCKVCSLGSVGIIGNETIYADYCEACNRVVFMENGIKKCSELATAGSNFIDITGKKVNCNVTSEIEIYNSDKAMDLCEMCTTKKREVIIEGDKRYCKLVG